MVRITTYWKSDTVRFVFGNLNVGNSGSQSKTIAEVTPTDVYIRSRSVPRAIRMPSHTLLRVHQYILQRGYLSVSPIEKASDSLSYEDGHQGYPRFFLYVVEARDY